MDRHGRAHTYLRVSVTDRCNFRCGYCMPPEGFPWKERAEILTFEEIERVVRIFAEMGVTKVRLTGGEPTVRRDIVKLVQRLRPIEGLREIAMTTNGHALERLAAPLREAGLNVLNISLDSLQRERFKEITRLDKLEAVQRGIHAALAQGFEEVKINVVVMANVNEGEILDFVDLTREQPLQVRFIEFMPFQGNQWSRAGLYPYSKMLEQIQAKHTLEPIETASSAVGKDFRIPGYGGSLGFVTSMTESFCAGCNRVRLLADGQVKPCLFLPAEVGLRDAMRAGCADEHLEQLIRSSLEKKWKQHPPMDELVRLDNRRMIEIGG